MLQMRPWKKQINKNLIQYHTAGKCYIVKPGSLGLDEGSGKQDNPGDGSRAVGCYWGPSAPSAADPRLAVANGVEWIPKAVLLPLTGSSAWDLFSFYWIIYSNEGIYITWVSFKLKNGSLNGSSIWGGPGNGSICLEEVQSRDRESSLQVPARKPWGAEQLQARGGCCSEVLWSVGEPGLRLGLKNMWVCMQRPFIN